MLLALIWYKFGGWASFPHSIRDFEGSLLGRYTRMLQNCKICLEYLCLVWGVVSLDELRPSSPWDKQRQGKEEFVEPASRYPE